MSTITTAGAWIALPTALGADDRARKDQPGDAALFQILQSNATLATRENELRVLWERGPLEVWADCATTDDERTLLWSETEGNGVLATYAGTHRVRLYGETQRPPRITLAARGAAYTGTTLGIVILVMPRFGAPDPTVPTMAAARTTSTTAVNLTATISLTPEALGDVSLSPWGGTAAPTSDVPESGRMTEVTVYVGAWSTSNSSGSKAALSALAVYLSPPV